MDRNTLLAFVLSMGVFTLYLLYQQSIQPPPGEMAQTPGGEVVEQVGGEQRAPEPAAPVEKPPIVADEPHGGKPSIPAKGPGAEPWQRSFAGELYEATLSNRGATLTRWELRKFHSAGTGRDKNEEPIELVQIGESAGGVFGTPFRELGYGDLSDHYYRVVSESDTSAELLLEVGDVEIRKRYEFDLEAYTVKLSVDVMNGSDHIIAPEFALSWPTAVVEDAGADFSEQSLVALHSEDVERKAVGSVGVPSFFSNWFGGGDDVVWRHVAWAGSDLKYFASVMLPEQSDGTVVVFEPIEAGVSAETVLSFRAVDIAPGNAATQRVTGFLGPKDPVVLEGMGRDLMESVNLGYSWIHPLTRFFQWLMLACYAYIPNYGWTIIFITIMVRIVTLPILNRQMKSMEKMRALQPRLKELQAKFSDDRQKQSEATMALYKETGVNPLGGCLPMLLQFPVFIGLFFALQSSFELRQAPFMLWITDLSAPESLLTLPGIDIPLRVLPLIMGASMFLQQKLTPTTIDPSQQMMMTVIMPVMMTVLFYQFPSGLVLYWMVSNFLGIAHQLFVGRRMRAAEEAA